MQRLYKKRHLVIQHENQEETLKESLFLPMIIQSRHQKNKNKRSLTILKFEFLKKTRYKRRRQKKQKKLKRKNHLSRQSPRQRRLPQSRNHQQQLLFLLKSPSKQPLFKHPNKRKSQLLLILNLMCQPLQLWRATNLICKEFLMLKEKSTVHVLRTKNSKKSLSKYLFKISKQNS